MNIPALLVKNAYYGLRARQRAREEEGNPPHRPPGEQLSDYVDQHIRFPLQRLRYRDVQNTHCMGKLPPELDFLIISMLQDNYDTLRTCSLVCRAWLMPCRRFLFSDIELIRHHAYPFPRLLHAPFSTLPTHFRSVKLADTRYWQTVDALLRHFIIAKSTIQSLQLQLYTPLKVPHISSLGVTALELLLRGKSLCSSKMPICNLRDLTIMLSQSFPALESLKLVILEFIQESKLNSFTRIPGSASPAPNLKQLFIHTGHSRQSARLLMQWFLEPEHNLRLSGLGDLCVPGTENGHFVQYLRRFGIHLESLEICGEMKPPQSSLPRRLSYDMYFPPEETFLLPNLKLLQITFLPRFFVGGGEEFPSETFKRILSRCPKLRCLTLRYSGRLQTRLVQLPVHSVMWELGFQASDEIEGDVLGIIMPEDVIRCYRPRNIPRDEG